MCTVGVAFWNVSLVRSASIHAVACQPVSAAWTASSVAEQHIITTTSAADDQQQQQQLWQ